MEEATQSGADSQNELPQDSDFANEIASLLGNENGTEEESSQEVASDGGQADETQTDAVAEPIFTIKVDGEERQVKQSELIADAQKYQSATKRFDEAAQLRREVETQQQQTAQERQALGQALNQYSEQLKSIMPAAPDMALIETDPTEYLRQKEMYQRYRDELQRVEADKTYLGQQQQAEQQKLMQAHMAEQSAKLLTVIPEWKDEAKRKAGVDELRVFLSKEGFTDQEIGSVTDARLVRLLREASMFRSLATKQAPAVQKVAKLPPKVEKTGAAAPVADQNRGRMMKDLRQSGKVSSAASLIESML